MPDAEVTKEPAVIEAPESKPESTESKPAETPAEKPKEQTIGELLNPTESKKDNAIPEAAFLSEKKGRQEAQKRIKELEAQIAAGATKEEVSDEMDSIYDEFAVDENSRRFFKKMEKTLETRAERRAEAKLSEKLAPLEAKERSQQINEAFTKHFSSAMEQFPDLQGVVNAEVIKAYSLDPRNANKTFTQLIEEAYGNATQGKRTIETATPRGGKEPEAVDFDRTKKDQAYMEQILSNPTTKAEYNKGLIDRISRHL